MARLDHVGLKVTDLDRSVRFYNQLFGFEELERRKIGGNVVTLALRVGDSILFLLNREDYQRHDPEALRNWAQALDALGRAKDADEKRALADAVARENRAEPPAILALRR